MGNRIPKAPNRILERLIAAYRRRSMSPTDYAELMRSKLHSMGEHCAISPHAVITDPHLLVVGDNVRLARCTIFGHDGSVNMINRKLGTALDSVGSVYIGSNVFIGEGTIILPGTRIGNDVIVGAGSVVRGTLHSGSVYAGNPAKPICSMQEHVEKLRQRNDAYPWSSLLAAERTPALEAKLAQMRVDYFLGGKPGKHSHPDERSDAMHLDAALRERDDG